MLKALRLPAFAQYHQDFQQKAIQKSWGHIDYLSQLCEQEVAQRFQKRIINWTRESRLAKGKSFATLQMQELPKDIQQIIIGLKENTQWAMHADNVLLIGPSGVGKSHIAVALGHHLIELGIRVKSFAATDLVQQLQQAKKDLDLMGFMSRLDKYRVLVIDDIGYVKKTDSETQVLFEFIAHRYESGSLIITSNQPFSHWDQIFPDTLMTVAAIDRIIHHATIVEIDGDSYRKKHQQKTK
jgi:DNA replication protein DnaC